MTKSEEIMKFLMIQIKQISKKDIYHKLLQIEKIMSALQQQIDAITAQNEKSRLEIIAKIDELQAKIDAGETVDLTALRASVQGIDDIVPDATVE